MGTERSARTGHKKRRALLLTIMALGAVVSLTVVNGVFAVFTDRATTGENSASSRGEARSADLQIATASFDEGEGVTTCGTYSEDLVTGIITASNMVPIGQDAVGRLCLKNVGSRSVDLTASVIDLIDTDHDCTGDEATLDASCGGDGIGELSRSLHTFVFDCVGPVMGSSGVDDLVSTPLSLGSLAPDAVVCLQINVQDQASGDMITIAQSDTVTWRFAFDGTAV